MRAKQTKENFWKQVAIKKRGCWEWVGYCTAEGYGHVTWNTKQYYAHRVAAWLAGLVKSPRAPKYGRTKTLVLHKCDNRKCCNPKHFFLGSRADNSADRIAKGR